METAKTHNPYNPPYFQNTYTISQRIIHTSSSFARSTLIYLQEVGELRALLPHVSTRSSLDSYLFFIVHAGGGELKYKGQRYELSTGDCVFIDCNDGYEQKTSSHKDETGQYDELWNLSRVHFNGASMSSIYTKYKERGGKSVFRAVDMERYIALIKQIFTIASGDDYVKDMQLAGKLTDLLT